MPSAITLTNVVYGAHTDFQIGPWVSAKAAGTLVDIGSTVDGVSFDVKTTYHEEIIDQRLGPVMAIPTKREGELKVTMNEATLANLLTALGQPTGNLAAGVFLLDPSAVEIYYQIKMIGKGIVGKTRTTVFWRTYPKAVGPFVTKKDVPQRFAMTFGVCEEVTGTGADNFCKITEA